MWQHVCAAATFTLLYVSNSAHDDDDDDDDHDEEEEDDEGKCCKTPFRVGSNCYYCKCQNSGS